MVERLYFSDGYVVDLDTVILSSGFLAAPDAASSMILFKTGEEWGGHGVPDDFVVSVTFVSSDQRFYALGRNGLVKSAGNKSVKFNLDSIAGNIQTTWIENVESRGNMERIRAIHNEVIACGWGGQIYRLVDGNWVPFEDGIRNPKQVAFVDIGGTGIDDLYAVGMNGAMYYCEGVNWRRLDAPTNCHLYSIYSVSHDEIYVCGSGGALYKGNQSKWEFIGNEDMVGNFWSLQEYQGSIYVSYTDGKLFKYDQTALLEVDMGLDFKPTTNRLHAKNGILWSFGEHHLMKFDGERWELVVCPENQ